MDNERIQNTMDNLSQLLGYKTPNTENTEEPIEKSKKTLKKLVYNTNVLATFKRNRIIFGAPGTGKSYTLDLDRKVLLGDNSDKNYERVTFHPEYTYANFVGTYKPVMIMNDYFDNLDETQRKIMSVLKDVEKSAQEKYDILYDYFKNDNLTRLPILLGIYNNDDFKTKKTDGSYTTNNNDVERNHGKAIRPYLNIQLDSVCKKDISYEYVPGPFIRILVQALKSAMSDEPKPFLLIIEEINRANVSAVFGDVFQLLDRDSNGVSQFAISTTYDMRRFLAKELDVPESEVESIKIPDNMFIWATMNSADQGVFPMDTAFKRRWDFTYLGINQSAKELPNKKYELGMGVNARSVSWNDIRIAINDVLSSEDFNINEDKLLGPFFIAKSILESDDNNEFINIFKNKVIMYLFEDAVKQKRRRFFEQCKVIRYSEICEQFDSKGVFIFPPAVSDRFKDDDAYRSVKLEGISG